MIMKNRYIDEDYITSKLRSIVTLNDDLKKIIVFLSVFLYVHSLLHQ